MALIDDLQKQVNDILSARGSVARAVAMGGSAKKALGAPLRGLGVSTPVVTPAQPFSPFDLGDAQEAVALASRLMSIADRNGAKGGLAGLVAALTELAQQLLTGRAGLAQHALTLFLTHHPLARAQLTYEPLEQRQPGAVRPSPLVPAGAKPTEDLLNFWREDPLLNEHHDHWHLVYPAVGAPVAGQEPKVADRQGELFVYMHQQMLARYDANRLSVGLPRVVPFDQYKAAVPEGYDPKGLKRWDGKDLLTYRPRPNGATLKDLTGRNATSPASGRRRPGAELDTMEKFRQRLLEAANRGTFEIRGQEIALTGANLAASIEANPGSVDYNRSDTSDPNNYQTYGNLHNDGHVHFANFDDSQDPSLGMGVMGDLATASRDPAFWRWHKHVDTFVQAWQEHQQPHDVSDGPPVTVRKATSAGGKAESTDIILCRKEGLPAGFAADLDGAKLGAEAFGYSADRNQWDSDFSSTTVTLSSGNTVTTTAELTTEMLKRRIKIPTAEDGSEKEETINYLSHDDFYYFLRLKNRSEQPQKVTVRIFLAPENGVDDRTLWVDMDRFPYQLKAQERTVICRPAELSSVIRKPAIRPRDIEAGRRPSDQPWCDCGWPYTMLLPRGTEQGMEFRILVTVTSGDDLLTDDTSKECTSVSYCGLQDRKYPDTRPMGYPFDRPLDVSSTIAKHENWASRLIKIRHRGVA